MGHLTLADVQPWAILQRLRAMRERSHVRGLANTLVTMSCGRLYQSDCRTPNALYIPVLLICFAVGVSTFFCTFLRRGTLVTILSSFDAMLTRGSVPTQQLSGEGDLFRV